MGETIPGPVSYGRRIIELAAEHPERTAILFVPREGPERALSWRELDRATNQVARLLADRGVDERSRVIIALPNCPEHYVVAYAAWKLGAFVLPLRAALPDHERDQILTLFIPTVVVSNWENIAYQNVSLAELRHAESLSDAPHPDRVPHPGKAIASGGSTGRPKIIVDPQRWERVPGGPPAFPWLMPGRTQLVAGPLYHTSPFMWSHFGLFEDHRLVLLERFDAARIVDLIERERINFSFLAPTMMRRLILLPNIHERDLSSVESIFQTAAPCPPWLKRAWIDLIGGEKLFEGFGSTENVGVCRIRGDEWLQHPGSVGRALGSDLKILDDHFNELPTGEVGEIFMRPHDTSQPTYEYIGSPPARTSPDGFASVGDLGYVDADGYLFLTDRRVDLIITGGANVYPAEVEAALTEHPGIHDVVVVGVPDEEWGKRVHAIIAVPDGETPISVAALDAHCRARLAAFKTPKSYEFVPELPRNEAGKIRRSALAAERAEGAIEGMVTIH